MRSERRDYCTGLENHVCSLAKARIVRCHFVAASACCSSRLLEAQESLRDSLVLLHHIVLSFVKHTLCFEDCVHGLDPPVRDLASGYEECHVCAIKLCTVPRATGWIGSDGWRRWCRGQLGTPEQFHRFRSHLVPKRRVLLERSCSVCCARRRSAPRP